MKMPQLPRLMKKFWPKQFIMKKSSLQKVMKFLRAWEILQPALDFWQNSSEETLRFYEKGTDWNENFNERKNQFLHELLRVKFPVTRFMKTKKVFAMLDIEPLSNGHVLVFPKKQS